MYSENEKTATIAAISTAVSQSGIGIVRISGPDSISIADRVCHFPGGTKKSLNSCPSHTIHYGWVYDGEERVDEVLVSLFRGPRSYTAEDTVEINCHGGVYAMRRVLQTVIGAGAQPAQPGEFTKRAFLNGRLDLSSAEAVMDVIDSQSRFALRNSLGQLGGSLREAVTDLRSRILHETAVIEAAMDDPEHYSLEGFGSELEKCLEGWLGQIGRMRDSYYEGRILSEGIRTVILGRPNAGKSSLLNVLLGEERAIVTEIPGTTRDTIREQVLLGEISLQIVDTAGIRTTGDAVENIGIERALQAAADADLCLVVIDSSEQLTEDDRRIIEVSAGKRCIYLLNKTDKEQVVDETQLRMYLQDRIGSAGTVIAISASSGAGIDALKETIRGFFYSGDIALDNQVIITNERHKKSLDEAWLFLEQVRTGLASGLPEDLLTIDLMGAYASLGEIIGEQVGEDLINEIFDKFCMGK